MIADLASQPTWPQANEEYLRAEFRHLLSAHSDAMAGAGGSRRGGRRPTGRTWMLNEPPAIESVVEAFRLSRPERDVLLWVAGVELDADVAAIAAASTGRPTVTVQLALDMVPGLDLASLSSSRALRRWGLVQVDGGQPLVARRLRIAERVLLYLAGAPGSEPMLEAIVRPVSVPTNVPTAHIEAADRIASVWAPTTEGWPVVELFGDDRDGRLDVAAVIADRLGWRLYRASSADLPEDPVDRHQLATLWARESILESTALFIDVHDTEAIRAARLADAIPGPVLIGCDAPLETRRLGHRVEVDRPRELARRHIWSAALGAELEGRIDIDAIAGRYGASRRAITQAAPAVRHALETGGDPMAALREELGRPAALADLARAIEPAAGWDDLVVPEPVRASLHQIADQVRNQTTVYERWGFATRGSRGLGITALFTGESGTGKTMAAEVLARDLGLDLFAVDLSAVVSKYIGETEKNLRRVFDAAEDGAILVFDEADALFGKRSEVKDSHDRYANVEISYLLQRMESYRGLAILTTNLKTALDRAFQRRIRFTVPFPFPDVASREQIWRRVFPPATPLYRTEWPRLAEVNVPGGSIRVIAINAAFLAASDGGPVRMRHLMQATEAELEKLDRPPTVADRRRWT